MKIAAELGKELGLLSQEDVDRHYYLIEDKLGFNNPFPEDLTTQKIMNAMIADNKKTGRELRFVLLEKIGQCYNLEGDFLVKFDQQVVRKILDNFIARQRQKRSVNLYDRVAYRMGLLKRLILSNPTLANSV